MTVAAVHKLPDMDPTDAMINRTVRALLAMRDMTPPELWEAAELPKTTYYNRMTGRRGSWTAPEVHRVAEALGVSVATLFEGLALPHLDSNQKPIGERLGELVEVDFVTHEWHVVEHVEAVAA